MASYLAEARGLDGIRLGPVAPDAVDTHLLHRLWQLSEIGGAVAFLGTVLSSFVTGTAQLPDGGLLAVI